MLCSQTDDWICTVCGAVVRKWMLSELHASFQNSEAPPVHTAKAHNPIHKHMINQKKDFVTRYMPDILRYSEILEVESRVCDKVIILLKRNELKGRPVHATIVAAFIIVMRHLRFRVDMKKIILLTGFKKLPKRVQQLSKHLGISFRRDVIDNLSYYISYLMIPHKYFKTIKKYINKLKEILCHVGPDTLIAIAIFIFVRKEKLERIYLKDIAEATSVCIHALNQHINSVKMDEINI
jgi:transcription initiation factor TFIIIB Brf1 subunit/transcription initiation factor TFIIB